MSAEDGDLEAHGLNAVKHFTRQSTNAAPFNEC